MFSFFQQAMQQGPIHDSGGGLGGKGGRYMFRNKRSHICTLPCNIFPSLCKKVCVCVWGGGQVLNVPPLPPHF